MEYVWPSLLWLLMQETPKKLFLSEIFRGLSLGHFGQHVPESPMSQLQNSVSTSSLPPFIVDLLTSAAKY